MYQDASTCRLVHIALTNAVGCGTEIGETDASRSGSRAATFHATAAPQSCPTRWTRSAPLASMSAATSASSSDIR
jgi:hypothetical protein